MKDVPKNLHSFKELPYVFDLNFDIKTYFEAISDFYDAIETINCFRRFLKDNQEHSELLEFFNELVGEINQP